MDNISPPKYTRTLEDGWYWLDDSSAGGWRVIHVENGAVKFIGTTVESRHDDTRLNNLNRIKIPPPVLHNDEPSRWF